MSENFQISNKEELYEALNQLVSLRVSDIFITANQSIGIRQLGEVHPTNYIAPGEETLFDMLNSVGDVKIHGQLSDGIAHPTGQVDGAISIPITSGGSQRFRYNYFRALDQRTLRQTVKISLRPLSDKIPNPEELLLPTQIIETIDRLKQGLVLVCGKTGQGKTTSLASILQHRADKFREHIITLEQPIEYILRSEHSILSQREVGLSTDSFAGGIRAAMRQNPDTILVGEIRDQETAEIALSAAESGHIVFGTLHTSNAAQSIERFINMFPTAAHGSVWNVLSTALKVIICQILVKDTEGHRVAAREILMVNVSVSAYIKQQDLQGVRRGMESGFVDSGMVNWQRAAEQLIRQGLITDETQKEIAALGD
jgi:twitching motility protein PilT